MATPTIAGAVPVNSATALDGDYALVTWTLTTADPTGVAVGYPDYADRTVEVHGTFGGATVEVQGSLDGGTTWVVLTDPQGNAISKVAAFLESVSEAVPKIRVVLTVVGVGASLTATLYVRK